MKYYSIGKFANLIGKTTQTWTCQHLLDTQLGEYDE
ncbi:hypothetical protein IKE_06209 [Bacillus cereus VD196]|uniref:Uncharacterized protein n=1 Tax=Bacillus cereus VD196 TaxID=1053243 RepID=A0A9W5V5N5_BACCE|nr:hypothetical protein IKE_06209 [Bacillus cereus VD196]